MKSDLDGQWSRFAELEFPRSQSRRLIEAGVKKVIEQAVILAGGKGTRLWPLTKDIPKPLVKVAGQPFLYWQLLYLKEQGFRRVLILVSHFAEKIQQHFQKNPIPGIEISFCQEPEALGTGGAVVNASAQLEETFFLLNGDSFMPLDYRQMEKEFQRAQAQIILAIALSDLIPEVPGNIQCEHGKLLSYRRDGGREAGYLWIDAGIYIYRKEALQGMSHGHFPLENTWQKSLQTKSVFVHPQQQRFFDIGTPERLRFFESHLRTFFPMKA